MGWRESVAKQTLCSKCKARPNASNGYCRECNAQYAREQYKLNPHQKRENAKAYGQRVRLRALRVVGCGVLFCRCCKESNPAFLSIDHINGGGNQQRKKDGISGGTKFFQWILSEANTKDFQLLCYNCNLGKRTRSVCPHKEASCLSL